MTKRKPQPCKNNKYKANNLNSGASSSSEGFSSPETKILRKSTKVVGGPTHPNEFISTNPMADGVENWQNLSGDDRWMLIFKMVAETQNLVAKSNERFCKIYEDISRRMDKTEENQKLILEQNAEILRKISINQQAAQFSPTSFVQALNDAETERENRKEKAPNMVLYGLEETDERTGQSIRADIDIVKDIFVQAKADPNAITEVFRLGQNDKRRTSTKNGKKFPRLLKIRTNSVPDKQKVMDFARNSGLKKIPELAKDNGFSRYIRKDMTDMELSQDYQKKAELKKRNDEEWQKKSGLKWKIGRGGFVQVPNVTLNPEEVIME